MMRHTPADRLMVQDALHEVRVMNDGVVVLTPTVTNGPTFDVDTNAAADVSIGDGTGRTFSWLAQQVSAMVREVNVHLITFGSVPPGAEIGDLLIAVGERDVVTFTTSQQNELSYVWARGERYRVWGVNGLGVAKVEGYVVWLRRSGSTVARHPDY